MIRFFRRFRKFGRYGYAFRKMFSDAGFKERTRLEFEAEQRRLNR